MKRLSINKWWTLAALTAGLAVGMNINLGRALAHEDDHDEDEYEEVEELMHHLELYGGVLELVERYHAIADDKTLSGVAAVLGAEDHVDGQEDLAAFFESVLPETENRTVRRAIQLKLIDVYEELDQRDKAQAVLKKLITVDD